MGFLTRHYYLLVLTAGLLLLLTADKKTEQEILASSSYSLRDIRVSAITLSAPNVNLGAPLGAVAKVLNTDLRDKIYCSWKILGSGDKVVATIRTSLALGAICTLSTASPSVKGTYTLSLEASDVVSRKVVFNDITFEVVPYQSCVLSGNYCGFDIIGKLCNVPDPGAGEIPATCDTGCCDHSAFAAHCEPANAACAGISICNYTCI